MITQKISLASDNCSGAHPEIMRALLEANDGYAPSYGADPWTLEAEQLIQSALKRPCKILFLPTGTGANVFALKLLCRAPDSVICTDIAHINYQESGAPEAIVGCKLVTAPHQLGKITPEELMKKLRGERAFGKHSTRPKVLSIAQPTEVGTVYTIDELKALSKLCKDESLYFHVDGSRFYNAAVALGVDLHDMIAAAKPDILSLGGTKNGLVGAEALVIFNDAFVDGSDFLQKQTLQLLSKMRFLSAQYIPYFKNKLWLALAQNANQKAREIATILVEIPKIKLSYPVETNQIFFEAPAELLPRIQEEIICLPWNRDRNEIRFIASWNTSSQDVAELREIFAKLR